MSPSCPPCHPCAGLRRRNRRHPRAAKEFTVTVPFSGRCAACPASGWSLPVTLQKPETGRKRFLCRHIPRRTLWTQERTGAVTRAAPRRGTHGGAPYRMRAPAGADVALLPSVGWGNTVQGLQDAPRKMPLRGSGGASCISSRAGCGQGAAVLMPAGPPVVFGAVAIMSIRAAAGQRPDPDLPARRPDAPAPTERAAGRRPRRSGPGGSLRPTPR